MVTQYERMCQIHYFLLQTDDVCNSSPGIGVFLGLSQLLGKEEYTIPRKCEECTPAQKVQIIEKHLVDRVPLSYLYDRYGLHKRQF